MSSPTARQYAEHSNCPVCEEFRDQLAKSDAAIAAAAEQLRAVMEANEKLQAENKKLNKIRFKLDGINTANKTLAWRLVDLFDRNVRGVSPLHYVEEQIKELQAENERLNEIIASYSMASILNRKQLSQANQDAGRWQGQAETWQQRAEISEAQLIRIGADRE